MSASIRVPAAVAQALAQALQDDPAVVVAGEAVGSGGLGGSTAGLLERFGPERVIDLPVADRGSLGFAVGLALGGRRPVLELSSTSRLLAVLEPLAEAAALSRQGEFSVPLVIRVPTGGEAGARVDRPVLEQLAGVEGLAVACPCDPQAATGLLKAALAASGPVVLLEPRALLRDRGAPAGSPLPLHQARVLREGGHLVLAAFGQGVPAALDAAEILAGEGIEAQVLDLVSLAPLDRGTLGPRVRDTGRLVVVHPASEPASGYPARVLQAALDEAFEFLEAPPAAAPADPAAIATAARAAVHY